MKNLLAAPRPPASLNTIQRAQRGFTLIELMIVVAIVGILSAVAYPSYMSQVRKSRRSDAIQALALLQQAQERWRSNNTTYATNAVMTTLWPNGLGFLPLGATSTTSSGGYYTLSIGTTPVTATPSTGYTIQAVAVAGTSQNSDIDCTTLTVEMANGNVTYKPIPPATCWQK